MTERAPIIMQRRGAFLVPEAPVDGEALADFPTGKRLKVKITQPRNLGQHRLYWAMLGLVCQNLDQPLSDKALHGWVKLKLGISEVVQQRNGETVLIPGSVAFDKMEQADFAKFFDQAVTLITQQIIPGLGKEALRREAELMLGIAA